MAKNRKKVPGRILADGELTGHAHRAAVDVYIGPDNTREFDGETEITHEEHKPVRLENKKWASAQVNEFDYLTKMVRPVQD